MIPVRPAEPQPDNASRPASGWQAQARAGRMPVDALLAQLDLSGIAATTDPNSPFPLRAPPGFVARMRMGDANDPLLRQVLPLKRERETTPEFGPDPLEETGGALDQGLLRKYDGRALLITTGACAIHCRYCFRRHFPYSEAAVTGSRLATAIEALRADSSIREVILSGGDPLSLGDDPLRRLLRELRDIDHIEVLRLHTRHPVVLPERVTGELCNTLRSFGRPVVVVIHANHAAELADDVEAALARLRAAGVHLLNQSVLLRGVNDDADTLVALSHRLLECGVLPYYLHLLDRVAGAADFEVPTEQALKLHATLHERLPGYLLPRLVREVPGAPGKTAVHAGGDTE